VSDILAMSLKEVSRAQVLEQLKSKHIKQREAAKRLGLSVRQIKRLIKRYRQQGAKGLVSAKRGRPSHHQLDPAIKAQALALVKDQYADFGPTLAHEKLTEVHHLKLGVETVRRLMIQAGLWRPRRAHHPVVHPLRERRARCGELVQIDGSPYAWFEDRAPACTLLVFIDDATGKLMALWFTDAESTFSYFEATEQYLRQHGKPQAFYSDKLSVFRINLPNDVTGGGTTQFTRAMTQLGIHVLCANTPQAKGRVERVNQTLQDRLVKELRLRGISGMVAGNAFLPQFMAEFNARFAVAPRSAEDAHRPLLAQDDLARILTVQEMRVLSKNLTLNYQTAVYQIQTSRPTYALRKATVVVSENARGEVVIAYKGKPLTYTIYRPAVRQAQVTTSKQLALMGETPPTTRQKRKPHIPAANHPWRQYATRNPSKPKLPK
jgi:transposase